MVFMIIKVKHLKIRFRIFVYNGCHDILIICMDLSKIAMMNN